VIFFKSTRIRRADLKLDNEVENMAVQMAPARAHDFIANMAVSDTGAATAIAAKTPGSGGVSSRESFDRLLAGARLAKSMYEEKYAISDEASDAAGEIEKFAEGLSDEDLSLLIAPISKGAEQMRDFADALDAEIMEGDVRGALELAGKAVEAVSRFDPDLILGGDFKSGKLHRLIEEFLNKFRVEQGEETQPETPEIPELPEIPAQAEIALPQDMENGENLEEIPSAVVVVPAVPSPAETPEIPGLPEEDSEEYTAGPADDEDETAANLADAPQDGTAAIAAFAEAIKAMESSRGTARQSEAPRPAPVKDGEGETMPKKPGLTSSVLKEGKIERQASGVGREDGIDPNGVAFAGELASAMKAKPGSAETTDTPKTSHAPTMTLPGATYELNGESPLGDGMRSVLEFMKNDGINEARIVVEPPALGRVDVSLHASGSGMEALFKVDNEALKQILQQQLDLLKTSLEAQGIHVSNLAVDIKNRDDQKGRPDLYGSRGKTHRVGGVAEADGEDEPRLARIDLEKGLLHWVA
jgi:hypothetical protein